MIGDTVVKVCYSVKRSKFYYRNHDSWRQIQKFHSYLGCSESNLGAFNTTFRPKKNGLFRVFGDALKQNHIFSQIAGRATFLRREIFLHEPHSLDSAGPDEVTFQDPLHNAAPPVRMEPTSNPTHQVGYSGPSARADPLPGCLPRPRSLICASPCLPCPRSNICLLVHGPLPFPPHGFSIPLPCPGLWLDGHNAGRNQLIRWAGF